MPQAKRILVVDDEESIRKLLRMNIQDQNHLVFEATSGAEALQAMSEKNIDVVILDLGLPDQSGFDVLVELRKHWKAPVLILTVQSQENDKVKALDLGADDYLVKPFSVAELKARLRVALRHTANIEKSTIYSCGPVELNTELQKVFVEKKEIHLSSIEFQLLDALCRRQGRVVTSHNLLVEVWGPGGADNSHYLRIYIGHLRKKIPLPSFIVTEPGVGYRISL